MVGEFAGSNNHGWYNVFIGWNAAASDVEASNRLYIANSDTPTPLIYGEFDNNLLRINGSLGVGTTPLYVSDVSAGGVSESQLHFSLLGTDTGG